MLRCFPVLCFFQTVLLFFQDCAVHYCRHGEYSQSYPVIQLIQREGYPADIPDNLYHLRKEKAVMVHCNRRIPRCQALYLTFQKPKKQHQKFLPILLLQLFHFHLNVNQFAEDLFLHCCFQIVHQSHPCHLIFRFQFLCHSCFLHHLRE